jgi:hypothetical protein
MSDPLARRVVARYLRALHDPQELLDRTEAAAHRAKEALRIITQAHVFWEDSVVRGDPIAKTEQAYRKILTHLKSYEADLMAAMASIAEYEHSHHSGDVVY